MDDYKLFSFYEKRGGDPKNGFSSFSEKGEYYFTYNNKNGDVIFISENYTTSTARNKGIRSVEKNMTDASRFKVVKAGNRKYHLSLKAGNNKEICISRNFASEKAAYEAASQVSGKKIEAPVVATSAKKSSSAKTASKKTTAAKVSSKTAVKKTTAKTAKVVSSKSTAKAKTVAKKTSTVKSKTAAASKTTAKVKPATTSKTATKTSKVKALTTSPSAKKVTTKVKPAAKPVVKKSATVKKATSKVASKTTSSAKPVAKTIAKPAVSKTSSAKTTLVSKPSSTSTSGSSSTSSASVKKPIVTSATTKSTSGTASTVKKVAAVGLAASAAAAASKSAFDYLSVAAYKGSDGFNSFQDNDSKAHYFSYNKGGKALLRSAGKKSETERNGLLESVKVSATNSKNWKKGKTVDGKYYYFLTNNENREIAKSAIYDNITDMKSDLTWISSNLNKPSVANVAKTASAATATIKTNQLTNKKQDASYSAGSNMNNEERERQRLQQLREQAMQNEQGGGNKWLPMLLLLLIPLLLGFLFLKGCNGCGGDKVVTKKPAVTKIIKDTKSNIDKAKTIVDRKKTNLGSYSGLNFERGTIEHTLKSCCDDSNCYDGKLYYWGEPNFSTNSAALSTASIASIENVARLMKSYRMSLTIGGNSSTNEDEGSAGGLSTARAKAMRDLLVSKGVDANKINFYGNGNGNTINYNGDSKADYQNRRLDIIINSCKSAGGMK